MSALPLALLLCVLLIRGWELPEDPENRWLSDDNPAMSYICPHGGSISVIVSQYNTKTNERVWDFACKASFKMRIHCNWTKYVNRFDEGINFSCPGNALICGVRNLHLDPYKDRKWRFYCCKSDQTCYANCKWTPYINHAEEYFSWNTPNDTFLVGAVRYHNNTKQRRWQYRYCEEFPTTVV
uniref:hemagglutinin/amebocyte aggregation factor-like n=1 Tax=Pristiophorus japonicus TaxID=55135 RepID=UPI00398F514A